MLKQIKVLYYRAAKNSSSALTELAQIADLWSFVFMGTLFQHSCWWLKPLHVSKEMGSTNEVKSMTFLPAHLDCAMWDHMSLDLYFLRLNRISSNEDKFRK